MYDSISGKRMYSQSPADLFNSNRSHNCVEPDLNFCSKLKHENVTRLSLKGSGKGRRRMGKRVLDGNR
jgi:hypothetical protein